ncbi:hypothetical protein ACNI0B_27000, partial [Escherichia coli]
EEFLQLALMGLVRLPGRKPGVAIRRWQACCPCVKGTLMVPLSFLSKDPRHWRVFLCLKSGAGR